MSPIAIQRRDADKWRRVRPRPGHIHGLPGSQGVVTATNGILCTIDQNGRTFIGHYDFFVADKTNDYAPTKGRKSTKSQRMEQEYV